MMAITETEQLLRLEGGLFDPCKSTALEKMRRRLTQEFSGINQTDTDWQTVAGTLLRIRLVSRVLDSDSYSYIMLYSMQRPDGITITANPVLKTDKINPLQISAIADVLAISAMLPESFCRHTLKEGRGQVAVTTKAPWDKEPKFPRAVKSFSLVKAGANILGVEVGKLEWLDREHIFDSNLQVPRHFIVNEGVPMLTKRWLLDRRPNPTI